MPRHNVWEVTGVAINEYIIGWVPSQRRTVTFLTKGTNGTVTSSEIVLQIEMTCNGRCVSKYNKDS